MQYSWHGMYRLYFGSIYQKGHPNAQCQYIQHPVLWLSENHNPDRRLINAVRFHIFLQMFRQVPFENMFYLISQKPLLLFL